MLESTSTFGPPDLDTRPHGVGRDAFAYDVALCPDCGLAFTPRPTYATEFVAYAQPVKELLATTAYRDQRFDDTIVESFRKAALVALTRGSHAEAGWAYLKGAWLSDDASSVLKAKTLREWAAAEFQAADSAGEVVVKPQELTGLLIADVLRCAGRYEDARRECERAGTVTRGTEYADVVARELELIDARDSSSRKAPAR